MSIEEGRRRYADAHRKYDDDALPPTASKVQRAALRYRADKGDVLAVKALEQYDARHKGSGDVESHAASVSVGSERHHPRGGRLWRAPGPGTGGGLPPWREGETIRPIGGPR